MAKALFNYGFSFSILATTLSYLAGNQALINLVKHAAASFIA